MKAIILAAGRGKRMGEHTINKPKCLISFSGKTLLEWQIKKLNNAGITKIAIVTGYCAEKLHNHKLNFFLNKDWNNTNMVSSLLCAETWLKNESCIISYADILYPSEVVIRLMKDTNDIALAYDKNWRNLWTKRFENPLNDAETFQVNDQGFITEIGNNPTDISEIEGQYMGLIKITPRGFHIIANFLKYLDPTKVKNMDMTMLFRLLISNGVRIHSVALTEPWLEFDNPNDIKVYNDLLKTGNLDTLFTR